MFVLFFLEVVLEDAIISSLLVLFEASLVGVGESLRDCNAKLLTPERIENICVIVICDVIIFSDRIIKV